MESLRREAMREHSGVIEEMHETALGCMLRAPLINGICGNMKRFLLQGVSL